MTQIKFIFFDVGGVIIRDFSGTNKWEELKTGLGILPEQSEKFNEIFDKYEPEVCVGRDAESLIPMLKVKFGLQLPVHYSFLSDFVNRFERNESIWPILKKLKTEYKLGLLTNMYPNMLDTIYKANLMPTDVDWDVVIDSSVEKVSKPQIEIFELAQERSGYKSDEMLYIDNVEKNTDAAKKFGWKTFLYESANISESNKKLIELFDLVL